jgi:DNA-binding CsgD family transcriptional regulator
MKKLLICLLVIIMSLAFVSCKVEPVETTNYLAGVQTVQELLATEPMSRWQTYCALTTYGYTNDEIDAILNMADVNWAQQAALICQTQIDTYPISKQALIGHLIILQFTSEEIDYGLKSLGAIKWEDQCLYAAMLYIGEGITDRDVVTQKLVEDGYTDSEIAYAIALSYAEDN